MRLNANEISELPGISTERLKSAQDWFPKNKLVLNNDKNKISMLLTQAEKQTLKSSRLWMCPAESIHTL